MKKYLIIVFCAIVVILQVLHIEPSDKVTQEMLAVVPSNARYVCLVDFGKLSCNDRLFVYDMKEKKYIYSSRVQHGNGGKSTALKPELSNQPGSNCSSVGLYKVTCLGKMRSNQMVECL